MEDKQSKLKTKANRVKKRLSKKNPCKKLKSGTKEKIQCQYDNKLISQKNFLRKIRKFTGKKKGLTNTTSYEYLDNSDNN